MPSATVEDLFPKIRNYEIPGIPGIFAENPPEDSAAEKVKQEWEAARQAKILNACNQKHHYIIMMLCNYLSSSKVQRIAHTATLFPARIADAVRKVSQITAELPEIGKLDKSDRCDYLLSHEPAPLFHTRMGVTPNGTIVPFGKRLAHTQPSIPVPVPW